ncbi:MAG TPA: hypothetical protein VEB00_14565 [Clostridia bacterium]|nr:hypothetical protein [Clostridia bacterium]
MASKENQDAIVDITQLYEFYDREGNQTGKKLLKLKFKLISQEAIEKMVLGAGFTIKEFYGDYQKNPYDESKSPFMIYVLEK